MASSSCQKCLLRSSIQYATPPRPSMRLPKCSNSFSTTATAHHPQPKKGETMKGASMSFSKGKKKDFTKTGKPPAPGERKASRKRIVLSNTNALEVPGMSDVNPQALLNKENIGKVFALPGEVVDSLRAVEAFKTTQAWGMFRKPGMLIRKDSVKLAQILQKGERVSPEDVRAAAHVREGRSQVYLVHGHRASGKSMMLLQAMVFAFMKGWVVLHIPETQELTTAVTDYSPIKGTKPPQYSQNEYTAKWLAQIARSNDAVLSTLTVSKAHRLPIPIEHGITLARLAELGARDPDVAWPFFQALWEELTAPGRPPILLSLDGLNRACRASDYRSPDFSLIHAHDLVILGHFFSYFTKQKTLPNGGAILAATTMGNIPKNEALDLAIKQKEEKQALGHVVTQPDPFKPVVQRDYDALQKAELMPIGGLDKDEARGLMEYWAASGVLRARIDEKTVVEKWALAGNGIVGEIERGALRMRI